MAAINDPQVSDPRTALLLVVLQNVVLIALTIALFWAGVFVARRLGRSASYSLSSLGFSRPRGGLLAGTGLGMTIGFGALIASAAVNALSATVVERLGYSAESRVQQPFMQGLQQWVRESPEFAIPAMVFVVVFFGPFVEELVFRGAVFNGLYRLGALISTGGTKDFGGVAEKVSFALAALASSAVFALLHLEPVLLPALVILAVALCALFRRTGSLLPSFAAHATFNSFAVLIIILSGLNVLPVPA